MGISLGGMIALAAALAHPDAFERLVVADSLASTTGAEFRQLADRWAALLQETDGPSKLLTQIAQTAAGGALPAAIRLVISEARTFPDLATIWHDTVVAPMLAALADLIARGQLLGEIGPANRAFSPFRSPGRC